MRGSGGGGGDCESEERRGGGDCESEESDGGGGLVDGGLRRPRLWTGAIFHLGFNMELGFGSG